MSDSSGGGLSDLDDIDDLEMIMQQVQSEQEQEAAAERVRMSRKLSLRLSYGIMLFLNLFYGFRLDLLKLRLVG
ncbi:hypothetical protein Tco_0853793 [Tanacetum coccineum]